MFRGLRVGESELNRFKSLPLILIQVQSNLHCSVSGKSRAGDPIPALDPATAGDPIPTLAPATGFKMQCWEFATGSPQNRKSATAEQTFSLRICDTQI